MIPYTAEMAQWPFPHVVLDAIWDDSLLVRVANEFPESGWKSYQTPNEYKLESAQLGPAAIELFEALGSEGFRSELTELTGIEGLSMEVVGGGYHLIPPEGRLGVHTDFNRSPATGHFRRLNLLIYLNAGWQDAGGHLELWPEDKAERARGEHVSIAPEWNRTVIFETSYRSWHGHPVPAKRWRSSVAAYYYTVDPPDWHDYDQSTVWMS